MSEDYRELLVKATSATDKAESVGILAKILEGEGGKDFILGLGREDGESCIEILDYVSLDSHRVLLSLSQPQGLSVRSLGIERQTFSFFLWELTATHGRLPNSVTIKEGLEILPEVHKSSGISYIQMGKYKGNTVAVKTLRPEYVLRGTQRKVCRG